MDCIDAAKDELQSVAFLTGAGVFQAVGLTLLALGLANRGQQLVRQDVAGLTVVPRQFGPRGAGLVLSLITNLIVWATWPLASVLPP